MSKRLVLACILLFFVSISAFAAKKLPFTTANLQCDEFYQHLKIKFSGLAIKRVYSEKGEYSCQISFEGYQLSFEKFEGREGVLDELLVILEQRQWHMLGDALDDNFYFRTSLVKDHVQLDLFQTIETEPRNLCDETGGWQKYTQCFSDQPAGKKKLKFKLTFQDRWHSIRLPWLQFSFEVPNLWFYGKPRVNTAAGQPGLALNIEDNEKIQLQITHSKKRPEVLFSKDIADVEAEFYHNTNTSFYLRRRQAQTFTAWLVHLPDVELYIEMRGPSDFFKENGPYLNRVLWSMRKSESLVKSPPRVLYVKELREKLFKVLKTHYPQASFDSYTILDSLGRRNYYLGLQARADKLGGNLVKAVDDLERLARQAAGNNWSLKQQNSNKVSIERQFFDNFASMKVAGSLTGIEGLCEQADYNAQQECIGRLTPAKTTMILYFQFTGFSFE